MTGLDFHSPTGRKKIYPSSVLLHLEMRRDVSLFGTQEVRRKFLFEKFERAASFAGREFDSESIGKLVERLHSRKFCWKLSRQ